MKVKLLVTLITLAFCFLGFKAWDYPIDGYERTGIKRLLYWQRVQSGELKSTRIPIGAYKPLDYVRLNLVDRKDEISGELPAIDPDLQEKASGLFKGMDKNYSLTLLDMTPNKPIRYAQHREAAQYQPGSVGKLVVLACFFDGLSKIYPDDFEKRVALLKKKEVTAGNWALADHHTIPVYDIDTERLSHRKVRADDVFSLYEWLDNMVSVSNNGAASVVWREALLMHIFKDEYPDLTFEQSEEYFKSQPKSGLIQNGDRDREPAVAGFRYYGR